MRRKDQLKKIAWVLINQELTENEKLSEIRRIANWEPTQIRQIKEEAKERVYKYSVENIIDQIQDYSGFTISELSERSRKPELVLARQLAHFKAFKLTKSSLTDIGKAIGNKDHATVLHSIKTIQNYLDVDKLFRQQHAEFLEL